VQGYSAAMAWGVAILRAAVVLVVILIDARPARRG
jgi:hypothetical protein